MFNFKKSLNILFGLILIFLTLSRAFATDNIFNIQYIQKIDDSTYKIYGDNFGTNPSDIKIFGNSKELTNINRTLGDNVIEIKKLQKDGGEIYLEKTTHEIGIDGKNIEKQEKSNSIKVIKEDKLVLNSNYYYESKQGKDLIIIPFAKEFAYYAANNDYYAIEKNLMLNINGTDFNLIKDNGVYDNDKYYYNNKYISIPSKNLKEINNKIQLKIDDKYSSYIIVNKEKYTLEKPYETTFEDGNNTKYMRLRFNKPSYIDNLKGYEIYVNGTKILENDATIGLNILSLKIDLSKFTKDDRYINIYLKNINTNDYSNKITLNIEKIIENKITKLDLGDGKTANFNLKITGNANGFIGDIYKLMVNINGIDYVEGGTKSLVKDANGVVQKDVYGNEKFEMKNIFNFVRNNDYLEGNFYYSLLNEGENIIYIKNGNSGRESNKISFFKGKYSTINYNYFTGAILTNTGKENIIFENGIDFSNKKIDFINKPEKDLILGKINFNNLKENDVYNISFKISTNIKTNPFYDLKLNTLSLVKNTEKDGTISYIFNETLLGKDYKSGNLIANLNELFNIDEKNIKLTLGNFSIKKEDIDNNTVELFSNKKTTEINFGYLYDFSNCFDGEKDYCGIKNINDSSLTMSLAFGKDINTIETPIQAIDIQKTTNTKKNTVINILDYKTEKFLIYNDKFIKLYDKLKSKSFTSRQLSSLKLGINNILQGLKDYEDGKSKIEANYLIKTNLKSIVTIINSLSK